MSDEMRRALARRAVELGDVDAAKALVRVLEREGLARDWPLDPGARLWDLTDADFGAAPGRRVKILKFVARAARIWERSANYEEAFQRERSLTLREIAEIPFETLRAAKGSGAILLAALDAALARAGLTIKNDPTITVPMASPPSLSPQREANASP